MDNKELIRRINELQQRLTIPEVALYSPKVMAIRKELGELWLAHEEQIRELVSDSALECTEEVDDELRERLEKARVEGQTRGRFIE